MSTVTASQLKPALRACIEAHQSSVILGHSGIGKSEIVQQLGVEINAIVVLFDVSGKQPVDVAGPPIIVEVDGVKFSTFATPKFFHDLNALAKREDRIIILFIDEITSADLPTLRTCYPIVNQNELPGGYKLDPRIHVIATGNLPTSGTGVRALPTAITSGRVAQFILEFDAAAWRIWARGAAIDYRFRGFADWRPALINCFDGAVRGPQSTPRSIVRYSKIAAQLTPPGVEHTREDIETRRHCGEALVGEGVAAEVEHFLKVASSLPKRDSILRHPDTTRVPEVSTEVDVLYALTVSLAHTVRPETADPIFKYVSRFPGEFQQLFVSDAIARTPSLKADSAYSAWIRNNPEA